MATTQQDNMTTVGSGFDGQFGSQGGERGANDLNFGSARSDYGDLAYGGSLNDDGTGGKSYDDFSEGRRDAGSKGYAQVKRGRGGKSYAQKRGGVSTGLMFIGGIGLGALVMYLLDPEQGRHRRASVRDQINSATRKGSEQLGKKMRHLQNRAQGVIADARSTVGDTVGSITGSSNEPNANQKQTAQGQTEGGTNPQARAANAR